MNPALMISTFLWGFGLMFYAIRSTVVRERAKDLGEKVPAWAIPGWLLMNAMTWACGVGLISLLATHSFG